MGLDLNNVTPREGRLLQVGLKALGYYAGTTRGVPGPKTKAAMAAYLSDGDPSGVGARMVRVARDEVGVRESPRNSNRGKRVREYQAATWLEGTGWAWCAAFVCWVCREAGMTADWRPQTAGAWDFERWARKCPRARLVKPAHKELMRAGDIVVFVESHIGIAADDQDGSEVRTIEGNTDASGSREGGGVYARTRRVSEIRSFIRIS